MKSIKVCEYSRSMSFHDDLMLQDQASGERSKDQWSSGLNVFLKLHLILYVFDVTKTQLRHKYFNRLLWLKLFQTLIMTYE